VQLIQALGPNYKLMKAFTILLHSTAEPCTTQKPALFFLPPVRVICIEGGATTHA
jgi:hypothetical protein